jgi:nucleotide-binding universal stress UspA family protein
MGHVTYGERRADGERVAAALPKKRRLSRKRAIGSVLYVTAGRKRQSASLQQAARLAAALGVDLFVLSVLPSRLPLLARLASYVGIDRRRAGPERVIAENERMQLWCDDVLSKQVPTERLRVRAGSFIHEAAACARELPEPVIVLPPSIARAGATATTLASASSRAVLVVRPPARTPTVMAASDLEKDDTEVVERAVTLGSQLGGTVIAMHNMGCAGWAVPIGSPVLAAAISGPDVALADLTRARIVERLSPFSTIVTSEVDSARAIVEQARVHRVDTIVVGTSARSRLERFFAPSVAAEVVTRADRSVLVTPRTAPGH